MDTIDLVFGYADKIKNSRTPESITLHGAGEYDELIEEVGKYVQGEPEGEDGIVGEVADVMACLIDLLRQTNPDLTSDQFKEVLRKKCDKWVEKYGNA